MALEHQFAALVMYRAAQADDTGGAVWGDLVHFQRSVERVAGEYRLQKSAGLLKEADQRVLCHEWKHAGTGGGLDVNAGTAILNNSIVALNTNGGTAADDIAGTVSPKNVTSAIVIEVMGSLGPAKTGSNVSIYCVCRQLRIPISLALRASSGEEIC